ncbi:MAG: site-2 protease family protein [Candidatus Nanohaloarchaea archaeon]
MAGINLRLVFLVAMVAAVGYILWRDRDSVQRQSILFYRRTQRGVEFIDRVAKRFPRFWNFYGWIGVVAAFLSIPLVMGNIGYAVFQRFLTGTGGGGISVIAPGLVSQNQFQSGVSFIPVEYWIIGIGILMVVHEFSHGIVARSQGFEINSVGWIIFGIIPGAFVEPKGENMLPGDEDSGEDTEGGDSGGLWDQGSWTGRLKVLAAGSWANYLTAAVFFIAALGVSTAVTQQGQGVFYIAENGTAADRAGMNNGTLYSVNGQRFSSVEELMNITSELEPGARVDVWTSEGNFTLTLEERNNSERGYMGVRVGNSREVRESLSPYQNLLEWFVSLLQTVSILNLGIGLFNMLPAKPLDGGQVLDTLAERFAPSLRGAVNYWSLAVWLVLILSLVLSIFGI